MRLSTPDTVRKLQRALHAKAKGSPGFRFYSLYDKLYRPGVLRFAYRCCRANEGAPGVDGQTFEEIEAYGVNRWLEELADAYGLVNRHTSNRLRRWLRRKHKVPGRGTSRFPNQYLYNTLGLVQLKPRRRNLPCAKG